MGKPFLIRAKVLIEGGFPLFSASKLEIMKVVEIFRESCAEGGCLCHCTGESAMGLFREAYGEKYIEGDVGRDIGIS